MLPTRRGFIGAVLGVALLSAPACDEGDASGVDADAGTEGEGEAAGEGEGEGESAGEGEGEGEASDWQECERDLDCGPAALCIKPPGTHPRGHCRADCADEDDCGEGAQCVALSGRGDLCLPNAGRVTAVFDCEISAADAFQTCAGELVLRYLGQRASWSEHTITVVHHEERDFLMVAFLGELGPGELALVLQLPLETVAEATFHFPRDGKSSLFATRDGSLNTLTSLAFAAGGSVILEAAGTSPGDRVTGHMFAPYSAMAVPDAQCDSGRRACVDGSEHICDPRGVVWERTGECE